MLNSRGARTDPCGKPFFRRRNLLLWPFPVVRVIAAIANHLHDHVDHVSIRQQSQQLAGEAAVPYSVVGCCEVDETAPAFFKAEKLSSMSYVNRVTWSMADLPYRKPTCSCGSSGSMIVSTLE